MASDDLGRPAILRLPVQGPLTAERLARGFHALEQAYAALYFHEDLQQRAIRLAMSPRADEFVGFLRPFSGERVWYVRAPLSDWPYFLPDEPLLVVRLDFGSPGAGDLSGAAGPLETLRKTLIDRQERRKDREWREDLDREQQEVEIGLRRREQEKIRAEANQLEAAADETRFRVFKERYEFIEQIAGVEEARKWAARELALAAPPIEDLSGEGEVVPTLLEPPDTAPR